MRSRRGSASRLTRPAHTARRKRTCQDSIADGVNGQHSGLRSTEHGVRDGEAASVRMSGVKRGVTQAQVGTAFSSGARADPPGNIVGPNLHGGHSTLNAVKDLVKSGRT